MICCISPDKAVILMSIKNENLTPAERHEVTPGRPLIGAYLRRSKQEDAMLEETFGGDYREYKDRTGILFPKV